MWSSPNLRQEYVQALDQPRVNLAFPERQWPKLVNCIGCDAIPATNNTELLTVRLRAKESARGAR